ncbi:uncoupling protein 4 [Thecamonas trahens ATCC 50062]|uniref:Uncoupling protein 4 n=1 Tax=Thecamonas trahens ATCC 50062 TaxID=461836 RepID=A0A0L0D5J5_THETB|nr:uncoupling protein 4 [Thecamonas trahens ATCC 50062]KNC47642.1 uncoupling protein 4 [Thecamonas trahens ATCC 50062]|eukprot:XP_013759126.1 uncoupling protein 4 [Thecamonas trahens ATCC 50062]
MATPPPNSMAELEVVPPLLVDALDETPAQPVALWRRFVASAVSASVCEATLFPFDFLKTRLQVQTAKRGSRSHVSVFRLLRTLPSLSAAYTGVVPAVCRHIPYSSLRLVSYEILRDGLGLAPGTTPLLGLCLLGGLSGAMGQALASPFDRLKVAAQIEAHAAGHLKMGMIERVAAIVKSEGMLGLWRGVGPNVTRAFLTNFGDIAVYDTTKHWIQTTFDMPDSPLLHASSALVSGFSSTVCSCPADVVKSRVMALSIGDAHVSGFRVAVDIVRSEGISGLYRGFFPCWLRLAPFGLIFYVTYEKMRVLVGLDPF